VSQTSLGSSASTTSSGTVKPINAAQRGEAEADQSSIADDVDPFKPTPISTSPSRKKSLLSPVLAATQFSNPASTSSSLGSPNLMGSGAGAGAVGTAGGAGLGILSDEPSSIIENTERENVTGDRSENIFENPEYIQHAAESESFNRPSDPHQHNNNTFHYAAENADTDTEHHHHPDQNLEDEDRMLIESPTTTDTHQHNQHDHDHNDGNDQGHQSDSNGGRFRKDFSLDIERIADYLESHQLRQQQHHQQLVSSSLQKSMSYHNHNYNNNSSSRPGTPSTSNGSTKGWRRTPRMYEENTPLYTEDHRLGGPNESSIESRQPRFMFYSDTTGTLRSDLFERLPISDIGFSISDVLRSGPFWLDVCSPTNAEMHMFTRVFGIHPLTTEDILTSDTREKCEVFPNYYFITIRTFDSDEYSMTYLHPINVYIVVFRECVLSVSCSMLVFFFFCLFVC
jgi:hypothetical protein